MLLFLCHTRKYKASLLSARAKEHKSNLIKKVIIINEQLARPDKTTQECYSSPTEEKLTRAALKSEFDKHVLGDPSTLVILDSLNYIKGFRYELHCISKASGEKHGVVWLICSEEVAKKWNEKRSNDDRNKYSDDTMNELILRYEPPDQRNRWDRPLYRVDVNSTLNDSLLEELNILLNSDNISTNNGDETGYAAEKILNKSVYNMHSLSDAIKDSSQSTTVTSSKQLGSSFKRATAIGSGFRRGNGSKCTINDLKSTETVVKDEINTKEEINEPNKETVTLSAPKKREVKKMEDLVDSLLDSFLLDVEALKQGQSTKIATAASSNVLNDVDNISQGASTAFLGAQQGSSSVGNGNINVPIGSGKTFTMHVNRTVQIVEMKRLRRQYITWVKDNPPKDTSSTGIATSFLSFVQNQL